MMHYWGYSPGFSGFSILGFLFQIFFWGLIIMLIVKLFRGHSRGSCCGNQMNDEETTEDKSLEIVRERYAKGEIDKKEFEQMKKDLT